MKTFELFIQAEKIQAADWQSLENDIREYDKRFAIEIVFASNTVEFYLYSQKELSLLATKMKGFLLKPTLRNPIEHTDIHLRKINFKIPSHKNILEFEEKEQLKRGRKIERVVIESVDLLFMKSYRVKIFLLDHNKNKFVSSYMTFINPLLNFEFDFKNNLKIKRKTPPLFLKIDEITKLFSSNKEDGFLEVFGFPYFSNSTYFPIKNFEFDKHTLIVGQTGVGKSKFIELFIKEITRLGIREQYSIVVVDPHAVLYPQFLTLPSKMNFDFIHASCELFPDFSEPKIATELTLLLFKTLLREQFNAKMERVLKYVVYILLLQNQMTLFALKRFLTELEFRKEILDHIEEEHDYLIHFFETEFVEMQTKFYEIAIMPVLVLIDELNFIPAFSKTSPHRLEETLKANFLTCFSLNRIFLGDKATRLIAGFIIQQVFLIAQKQSLNKKIILIIDEVSLVENESMIAILSEARKFNLSLFLSQQYLTQISHDLLKSVLSNIYNYFIFKVSDEDAKILVNNLQMQFPDEILKKEKEKGISEDDLKRELLVSLNPRECLVRVFSQSKFYPCFKGKTPEV